MAQHSAHSTGVATARGPLQAKGRENTIHLTLPSNKEKTGCHRIFQKALDLGQGDYREEILGYCQHLEVQGDPQARKFKIPRLLLLLVLGAQHGGSAECHSPPPKAALGPPPAQPQT